MAAAGGLGGHSTPFEERLAAQFATAEWVLTGCHRKALSLLEGHFEAEEQARAEIARLRAENQTLCIRLTSLANGGDSSAGVNATFGGNAAHADGDASAGGAASPPPTAALPAPPLANSLQHRKSRPTSSPLLTPSGSSASLCYMNSVSVMQHSSNARVNNQLRGGLPGEVRDGGTGSESSENSGFRSTTSTSSYVRNSHSDKVCLSTLNEGCAYSDSERLANMHASLSRRVKIADPPPSRATTMSDMSVTSGQEHFNCDRAHHQALPQPTKKQSQQTSKVVDDHKRFELHQVWTQDLIHRAITGVEKSKLSLAAIKQNAMTDEEGAPKARWYTGKTQPIEVVDSRPYQAPACMLHPSTGKRALWDFLSLVFVAYDAVMIPMALFNLPDSNFLRHMIWTTRVFWTFDIPASFMTGYLRIDGHIEMKPSKVAFRYVKTWLILDTILVTIDWMEIIFSPSASLGVARLGKASRIIRIVRMLRLLRLLRMREVLRVVMERCRSERLVIALDVFKIILAILGLAHFIACFWYGIGKIDDHRSWPRDTFNGNESLAFSYAMSLHWSLAQFAGGMDEVTPENLGERIYAICVFLMCFMLAAVLVSSLTSSMTQLHIISSRQAKSFSVLRRYLIDNRISHMLSLRVERNARHTLSEQARYMPESSVELLLKVSDPLRVELHFEIYSPLLATHPFFESYIEECPQVMRKVCHDSNSMSFVSRGDILFNTGEIPPQPKMYFLSSGSLRYTSLSEEETLVHENQWVAEPTLWTHWMHRGTLEALTECRLCILDVQKFQEIVGHFHHPCFDPKTYATKFVKLLNAYDGELTDLSTGGEFEAMRAILPKRPPVLRAKSYLGNLQETLLAHTPVARRRFSSSWKSDNSCFYDVGPNSTDCGSSKKVNVVEVQS